MIQPIDKTVNGQATVVINDPNGNVTVIQGQSNTDVIFQPVNGNSFPVNPNDIQQSISQNGNTITTSVQDSVDLQVIVPEGANLNLTTDSVVITLAVPSSPAFHLDASTNSGSINSEPNPACVSSHTLRVGGCRAPGPSCDWLGGSYKIM
jgi:hypothetical protein